MSEKPLIIKMKHRFFANSFFSATIIEWNDLDYSRCNAPSINAFKQIILKFICLGPNNIIDIYNPYGLRLLTRLRLGLSYLHGHKFKHNFSDCLHEICVCVGKISNLRIISPMLLIS